MTTLPLSPAELADLFPGQVVVIEPISEPVAPKGGALVYWNDGANEGIIVQPLYSDKDRARMRRQMLGIVEEQTQKVTR